MTLESIAITNLMNKDIIVAEQELNLITISKIMSNNDIGSVVIVDDLDSRRPIGIITERYSQNNWNDTATTTNSSYTRPY